MKNQAISDLLKNLEEVKKIEELKILLDPAGKQRWLRQSVDDDCVGLKAQKNLEESKKVEHLNKLEPLKILAENLQKLKILPLRMNSHF